MSFVETAKREIIKDLMHEFPGLPYTSIETMAVIALGALVRTQREEQRKKVVPSDGGGNINERGPTALGGPPSVLREASVAQGYTGESCKDCGNFTMVRNGTCLKCTTCGSTSGCS